MDVEAARAANPARRLGDRLRGVPRIVYSGWRRQEIALTFDDGPSRWTLPIARVFADHGCRATFFLRGSAVERSPGTVTALADAGHELGNHLWTHTDPTTQTREEIRTEIERTATAIRAAGGPRPRLVRPPFARAPREVAEAARRCGVRAIVQRSVGSDDWAADAAGQIVEPLLGGVEPGDIVCLHDGVSADDSGAESREPTLEAVRRLVPALLERGLRPVTVSQMIGFRYSTRLRSIRSRNDGG